MNDFEVLQTILTSARHEDVLASFDPFGLSFKFKDFHGYNSQMVAPPSHAEQEGRFLLKEVTADEFERSAASLFSEVPTWLLVHELTHLLQMTSTSSGIRQFVNLFDLQTACILLIQAVAKQRQGVVEVNLLNSLLFEPEGEIRSRLMTVLEVYGRQILASGGLKIAASHARKRSAHASIGDRLFESRDIIIPGTTTWCFELSDSDGLSDTVVTLGNVHLYEAYAFIVEELRARSDWIRQPGEHVGDYISPTADAPLDPYRILPSIYYSWVEPLPDSWDQLIELMAVLDAALMYDDWLTGSPEDIQKAFQQRVGCKIDTFLQMCKSIQQNRGRLYLKGTNPTDIVQFQNALLEIIGAPLANVMALSRALADRHAALVEHLLHYNPPLEVYRNAWSRLFGDQLSYRISVADGGCPALGLVAKPIEELRSLVQHAPVVMVGGSPTDGDLGIEGISMYTPMHFLGLLQEIVLSGRQTCPIRSQCGLPDRSACHGVTDHLEPKGLRCARECAIIQIMGARVNGFKY
jgi:hypothetical protein